MVRALPNLAKIIAMRSVGVLSQTDKLGVTVSGEGCDLSTLGNAVMGENSKGGKLAAVDAATGIFVTAEYSGLSPELTVEKLDKEEEVFLSVCEETGSDESETTVYAMSDRGRAKTGYRLYIPLGSTEGKSGVEVYSYDKKTETATELSVTAEDSLYAADTDSIAYIAVVQKASGQGHSVKIFVILAGVLFAVTLAGTGLFLLRRHD